MKNAVVFIVVCVLSVSTYAQNVSFGAKAGVNFASLNGDDVDDLDGLTGLHIGGVVDISFSELLSLQPELLFSMQGAKYEYSDDVVSEEETYKLNYLNVPVLLKVKVDGFSFELGPQVGFLLSANEEYEYSDSFGSSSGDEDIKEFIKGVDVGGAFGVSYQLPMGLFFSGRYVLGFTSIDDTDQGDDADIKNGVIQLSAGWMFN